MSPPIRLVCARAGWLATVCSVLACSSDGAPKGGPRASEHAAEPSGASTPHASASPVASGDCAGLEPHRCAQTPGCLLDQETYSKLVCRAAVGCEARVRHADLIGKDADPKVDAAAMDAAKKACAADARCAATEGRCSCPCAILGGCDCSCGGSFLARCTERDTADLFRGPVRPAAVLDRLRPLARARAAVVAAPDDRPFRVEPMPPVDVLVGLRRSELSFLGEAHACTGPAQPSAPCQRANQAFFSFYKLPPSSVGGGPELLLDFDDQGQCSAARVTHTR